MIIENDDTPRENETRAWTVAVGNFPLPYQRKGIKQKAEKTIKIIKELDGLIGIHPEYPKGTLLLFRTLNDAKIATNILTARGIKTGDNICEVFIDKSYTE